MKKILQVASVFLSVQVLVLLGCSVITETGRVMTVTSTQREPLFGNVKEPKDIKVSSKTTNTTETKINTVETTTVRAHSDPNSVSTAIYTLASAVIILAAVLLITANGD